MLRLLLSISVLAATPLPALSQQAADTMTCAQAIAAYAKDRRIMMMANGRAMVPLYGWTPVGKAATVQCGSRSYLSSLTVRTTDNGRCEIAVRCR